VRKNLRVFALDPNLESDARGDYLRYVKRIESSTITSYLTGGLNIKHITVVLETPPEVIKTPSLIDSQMTKYLKAFGG
jgi:hypothetical protein